MQSMTGFAAREGRDETLSWRWELRSVNGRGLDVRYRGPDGREGVEAKFRAAAAERLSRGSINASLRLTRAAGAPTQRIDEAALTQAIEHAKAAAEAARAAGLEAAPVAPEALLSRPGVLTAADAAPDPERLAAQDALILADGEAALDDLAAARAEEGARLAAILTAQVDRIEALSAQAESAAAERAEAAGPALKRKLDALLEAGAPAEVGAERLAQELALLAVRGDVREELDRLGAHVAAARGLIAAEGPAGRKLDFLVQEFNREANTLCSKADFSALTEAGLELKTVIDQMREQAANVE